MTDLSPQQSEALQAIHRWYQTVPGPQQVFRLFGPAGTGKTTLAREVGTQLGLLPQAIQFAAYTGKAASVLRGKGCQPAGTLHSLVYKPRSNAEARKALTEANEDMAYMVNVASGTDQDVLNAGWASRTELAGHIDQRREDIEQLTEQCRTLGWEWNEDSELAYASLLILDEVSMVDAKLAADIERFEVPVLVLGDPEQLEPIGGEGYYIDAKPDFALTEIHRQALDSPVLNLATRIRTSTHRNLGLIEDDMEPRQLRAAMEHDQVLCWKNATRWRLITLIRDKLARPRGQVVAGDRIMCLTNNRTMGVFNGQQFTVLEATPGPLGPSLTVLDDSGNETVLLAHSQGFEGREAQDRAKSAYLGGKGNRGLFTFANAITVHKAQGSEWESVYVVNEAPDILQMTAARTSLTEGITAARRWLYTATTRASHRVTVTTPADSR